jgi:amidophosphoribosyltransferase
VPDSGVPAAIGFAEQAGLPFEMGLIRNHYVGRTFIEPSDSIRHFGVRLKLNAVPQLLRGKRVVVVDDSLVRGTTSRKIVRLVRQAGASEVHVRISSPPVNGSCFYGIDTPTRAELAASTQTVEQIRLAIEADSLGYLSPEGLRRAVGADARRSFCDACFTGDYPVPVTREPSPRQLRLIEV